MQFQSILTLGAISLVLAACQTPQQAVQQKEDLLAAAGIHAPAGQFARADCRHEEAPAEQVRPSDLGWDRSLCLRRSCRLPVRLFRQSTAWSNYRSAVFAKQLANEQQMTAMMNQDAFDFGPWGPGFW